MLLSYHKSYLMITTEKSPKTVKLIVNSAVETVAQDAFHATTITAVKKSARLAKPPRPNYRLRLL